MRLIACALALAAALALVGAGCARAPVKLTEKEETEALVQEVRAAIVRDLSERKDLRAIDTVELLGIEEDGRDQKRLAYRIVFASTGAPLGNAMHGLDASVTVSRTGEGQWKLEVIEPRAQELFFEQPATIAIPRKR
jgi:hypothetical protein